MNLFYASEEEEKLDDHDMLDETTLKIEPNTPKFLQKVHANFTGFVNASDLFQRVKPNFQITFEHQLSDNRVDLSYQNCWDKNSDSESLLENN